LKQQDKALADLSKAIEIRPALWDAWVWRAWFYSSHQQWDKVIADYSKALELNPTDPGSWHNRGLAYSHLKQWDKALADFTRLVELNPSYLGDIVEHCLSNGRPQEADTLIRQALAHFGKLAVESPAKSDLQKALAEASGAQ